MNITSSFKITPKKEKTKCICVYKINVLEFSKVSVTQSVFCVEVCEAMFSLCLFSFDNDISLLITTFDNHCVIFKLDWASIFMILFCDRMCLETYTSSMQLIRQEKYICTKVYC